MATATMKFCRCSLPGISINPRKAGSCLSCSRRLNPEWISSDATVTEFFRRLYETLPMGESRQINPATGTEEPTEDFIAFQAHCEARERAGRYEFGLRYLRRSNTSDALEEWTDGANYLLFDSLKTLRDTGEEDRDFDLVLTIARHAFKAYRATRELRRRRAHRSS